MFRFRELCSLMSNGTDVTQLVKAEWVYTAAKKMVLNPGSKLAKALSGLVAKSYAKCAVRVGKVFPLSHLLCEPPASWLCSSKVWLPKGLRQCPHTMILFVDIPLCWRV